MLKIETKQQSLAHSRNLVHDQEWKEGCTNERKGKTGTSLGGLAQDTLSLTNDFEWMYRRFFLNLEKKNGKAHTHTKALLVSLRNKSIQISQT